MIQVESDKSKNILRITFSKNVEPDQARLYVETVKARIAELKPGFRLLTDLSGLSSMDARCAPYIEKTMDVFSKGGVSKVVRVIPDPHVDIGFNIMSLFHYRRRIQIVTCETLAEAEKILAE
jgi:hypothetical protein